MRHELRVLRDAEAVARAGAREVAQQVAVAVADHGTCALAVSGGRTPWRMLRLLAAEADLAWQRVTVFQVDERVVPDDDEARNLTHLRDALTGVPVSLEPMDVMQQDLDGAADEYGARLPAHLDLVHLGLGADGHTASLVPGDPVLQVAHRPVSPTRPYQGHRRLTLTYPGLARSRRLLWLVTGQQKAGALRSLLDGDPHIPASRVRAGASLVLADADAADGLGPTGRVA